LSQIPEDKRSGRAAALFGGWHPGAGSLDIIYQGTAIQKELSTEAGTGHVWEDKLLVCIASSNYKGVADYSLESKEYNNGRIIATETTKKGCGCWKA
jgi:hypothetical protein